MDLPSTNSTHTEGQKRHIYGHLPASQRQQQTYTEWVKEVYHEQYDKWMPWLEDQYLKWFGKGENKASYVTKGEFLSVSLSSLVYYIHFFLYLLYLNTGE